MYKVFLFFQISEPFYTSFIILIFFNMIEVITADNSTQRQSRPNTERNEVLTTINEEPEPSTYTGYFKKP